MLYLLTLASLAILDFAWLSATAHIYSEALIGLFAQSFSLAPALMFYPLYALALYVLVLSPAVKAKTKTLTVILHAGLFGLAAYGAYDLTNQATLRDWPLLITVIDMAWGTFVTAAASGIAYVLFTRLKK